MFVIVGIFSENVKDAFVVFFGKVERSAFVVFGGVNVLLGVLIIYDR